MKSRIWEMRGGKYAKTLTKIQASAIFHMWDIWKNDLPKFTDLYMKTPCCCHPDEHQHGGRKPTERSFTGFCYENVNSSFGEIIIIEDIPLLTQWLFKRAKSSQFFNLHDSCFCRHVNGASRKSLEIQVHYTTKRHKPFRTKNLYRY